MYPGLNGATTMKADLETDLRAAERAGFASLEVWAPKLRALLADRPGGLPELRRRFARSPVKPLSINSVEFITFKRGTEREAVRSQTEELCRAAAELDCPYVVVVPSPLPEGLGAEAGTEARTEEVRCESVEVLRELSDLARPTGVKLAFEFLGFAWCSVSRLGECCRIVRETERENVGLVLDSFHFHAGGSALSEIEELDPEKLFLFHINDAEPRPPAELTDAHRLLPGEGAISLIDLLRGLNSRGYHGVASVELFRPEYWENDPFDLAVRAREATERLLARALQSVS